MGWGKCNAGPRAVPGSAAAPAAEGRAWTWAAHKGAAKREDRAGGGGSMSAADPNPAAGAVPDSDPDPGRAAVASAYQRFEPRAYLRNNYAPPRGDLSSPDGVGPWKLSCLAQTFATGEVSGHTLIDIGSGPTIYQLLSACTHFEDITMTDFLEVNRRELGLWLREEPGAFDWSMYSQHVCLIEGKGEPWQEKERQLRARVKRVLHIDVHQPQPLGAGSLAPLPADALVSAFCLEAVSPDLASFQRALDHITTLLRPGGHLLLIGALEESWYLAGEARLVVVPMCKEKVVEALVRSGYEVRDLRTYVMPACLQTGVDDVKGIFFAWAQKKVGV
ncbi:phenylethanolamine N-methyltransferase [Panthera tigris]|uniref:phenylethanolamine N-methyltransferase n=1 Tax=Panthera tigris TaxID=9694 RepID=UPI001C6F8015|nr:phenylethanolamine N-methyltransferase [Panthera tigris]XP_049491899.1 phenylethanolamine N-methyltransferase [Panthera uncia]